MEYGIGTCGNIGTHSFQIHSNIIFLDSISSIFDLSVDGDTRLENLGTLDNYATEYDLTKVGSVSEETNGIGQTFTGESEVYLKAPGSLIQGDAQPQNAIVFIHAYVEEISSGENYIIRADNVSKYIVCK